MTDEPTSDTGEKLEQPAKPGTFKKGYDPRRNLKGVPADAIAARKKIREIGAELAHVKEKVYDPETGGMKEVEYDITRWNAMIRLMFSSRAPKDREMLLKAGLPGLLKDEVEMNHKGGIEIVKKKVGVDLDKI